MKKVVTKLRQQVKLSDYQHLIGGNINKFTAQLLYLRGIRTKEEAEKHLFDDSLNDPSKIRHIDKAFELIDEAIQADDTIAVFGDYDADGIASTAIMYLTLRDIGANVITRLPDRLSEGYGMSVKAVDELHAKGAKLIITVDNGIKQHHEIKRAKSLGMNVIVIDHHTPDDVLPEADVVIDLYVPGETYPFLDLSGCGLAFKIACYLYDQYGMEGEGLKYLDLAAIGTVADVVPLTGENRVIVRRGLAMMNDRTYTRPGMLALFQLLGIERGTINEETIGFQIGPCLNAPGRLLEKGAELGLEFLLAREHEAVALAHELVRINQLRKDVTKNSMEAAYTYIAENEIENDKVLVLYLPNVPEGIVGLVSGRITEEYWRPSLVFTKGNEVFKASARSTPNFNLYEALTTVDDLLLRWGGHAQAAGMSIEPKEDILHELRKRLNEYADSRMSEDDLSQKVELDMEITEADITDDLMEALDLLAPFGEGNPKPMFMVKGYYTRKKNRNGKWEAFALMGEDESHLKLFGESTEAIGFGLATKYLEAGKPRKLDIVCSLSINSFMGRETVQLDILHFQARNHKEAERTALQGQLSEALKQLGI